MLYFSHSFQQSMLQCAEKSLRCTSVAVLGHGTCRCVAGGRVMDGCVVGWHVACGRVAGGQVAGGRVAGGHAVGGRVTGGSVVGGNAACWLAMGGCVATRSPPLRRAAASPSPGSAGRRSARRKSPSGPRHSGRTTSPAQQQPHWVASAYPWVPSGTAPVFKQISPALLEPRAQSSDSSASWRKLTGQPRRSCAHERTAPKALARP